VGARQSATSSVHGDAHLVVKVRKADVREGRREGQRPSTVERPHVSVGVSYGTFESSMPSSNRRKPKDVTPGVATEVEPCAVGTDDGLPLRTSNHQLWFAALDATKELRLPVVLKRTRGDCREKAVGLKPHLTARDVK
jgi:hypothetical protein